MSTLSRRSSFTLLLCCAAIYGCGTPETTGEPNAQAETNSDATVELESSHQAIDDGWLEPGVDRPGMDYAWFGSASAQNCQSSCRNDTRCRAFSYDSATRICWLKDAVPGPVLKPVTTSGIAAQVEYGYNRNLSDYTSRAVTPNVPEACLAECSREPYKCVAYTFVSPNTCWLKTSAPFPTVNSAMSSGVNRSKEYNTNRQGSDLGSSLTVASPQACETECAKNWLCLAYTYVPVSSTSGRCWLKGGIPPPSRATGLVSGVKRGLEYNVDRFGQDLSYFDTDSTRPQICQAACYQIQECRSFTFRPRSGSVTGRCWLKRGVPKRVSASGLISGVRGAEFF